MENYETKYEKLLAFIVGQRIAKKRVLEDYKYENEEDEFVEKLEHELFVLNDILDFIG